MDFKRYRTVVLIITGACLLLIAAPVVQPLLIYPQMTYLSELTLLGDNHAATYPSNISMGENSRLYLEVTNQLGKAAHYEIEMKFRNASQSGPDSFNFTSSSLEPLDSIPCDVADNQSVEVPIDVSFQYLTEPVTGRLTMQSIVLNGKTIDATGASVVWDPIRAGFYGNLVFELWIQNDTTNTLQYHERYVDLWFNMTS